MIIIILFFFFAHTPPSCFITPATWSSSVSLPLHTTMEHLCTFVVMIIVAMTANAEAPITEQSDNKSQVLRKSFDI